MTDAHRGGRRAGGAGRSRIICGCACDQGIWAPDVSIDVGHVPAWDEFFYQLLAELALHERVGRDHPDEARRFLPQPDAGAVGEIEEAFRERNGERVLAMTGSEAVRGMPWFCALSFGLT